MLVGWQTVPYMLEVVGFKGRFDGVLLPQEEPVLQHQK